MLSTVCYLIDALLQCLAPAAADISAAVFVIPETLSQVSMPLYLLIRGVRVAKPAPPEPTGT